MLRWQARLDSGWADRTLPAVFAIGATLGLFVLATARARSFSLEGADRSLSAAVQASWLLGNGSDGLLSVTDPPTTVRGLGSLVLYPLAAAVHLLPGDHAATALLAVQAAALGCTVLPLWRLARRVVNLRVGATVALVVAYLLLPPLHWLNLTGFHIEALALPALVVVWYRAATGSIVRLGAGVLFVAACRFDLALVIAALGIAVASSRRPRAGAAITAFGAAWFVAVVVWAPWGFGDGPIVMHGAFGPDEHLSWFLSHPWSAVTAITGRADLAVVAAVLLPLALLPLLSFRHLAPVLPILALSLLGDVPDALLLGPRSVPLVALAVVAAAHGLGRLGRPTLERLAVPPRTTAALVAAAALFFLLDAPASPYREPWTWSGRDAPDLVRLSFLRVVEADDVVMTTGDIAPDVAARRSICIVPQAAACPDDVSAVFLDTARLGSEVGASAVAGAIGSGGAEVGGDDRLPQPDLDPWRTESDNPAPADDPTIERLVSAGLPSRAYLDGRFVVAFAERARFAAFERSLAG